MLLDLSNWNTGIFVVLSVDFLLLHHLCYYVPTNRLTGCGQLVKMERKVWRLRLCVCVFVYVCVIIIYAHWMSYVLIRGHVMKRRRCFPNSTIGQWGPIRNHLLGYQSHLLQRCSSSLVYRGLEGINRWILSTRLTPETHWAKGSAARCRWNGHTHISRVTHCTESSSTWDLGRVELNRTWLILVCTRDA